MSLFISNNCSNFRKLLNVICASHFYTLSQLVIAFFSWRSLIKICLLRSDIALLYPILSSAAYTNCVCSLMTSFYNRISSFMQYGVNGTWITWFIVNQRGCRRFHRIRCLPYLIPIVLLRYVERASSIDLFTFPTISHLHWYLQT